jgi:ABC-2 type transport system permease protein
MVPVSGIALGYPIFFYSFLVQLLTFLYAGIVLNRAKQAGIHDLLATTPAPDQVFIAGKWLGIVFMQMGILLFLTCIISVIQLYSGYPVVTPLFTFFTLFEIHLSGFIIWGMLAMFVQAISGNTFTGLFILILITLGVLQMADMGIESPLLRFNAIPEPDFYFRYSDMAGYGGVMVSFFTYRFYWLTAGLFFLLLAMPIWQRERAGSIKERFIHISAKLKSRFYLRSFAIIFVCFLAITLYIKNFIHTKNPLLGIQDEAQILQAFKKEFASYLNLKQPVIKKLTANIKVVPGESFEIHGSYFLKNHHDSKIDTLLIRTSFHDHTFFTWQGVAEVIAINRNLKVEMVKLNKTLLPGDSLVLRFKVVHAGNLGYEKEKRIVQNGIYINNTVFPRIGWRDGSYTDDSLQKNHHYQGNDEHGILTDITISTVPGHQAFAPGNLVNSQSYLHENTFRYVTTTPIKFSFAVLSGKYFHRRDSTGNTQVSIWYHPTHTYCLSNMLNGIKSSIAYHEKWFSPLGFDTIKAIAFARSYGTFATLSANCIPVSEIRFLQDTNYLHQRGTDLGFYVMAHEMSHHWWGNQLQPAHAPGASMLTESLAEYVTLKVYEGHYGSARALEFLRIQKNRYLGGRAQAGKREPGLAKTGENDDYLAYGKGALAFYLLAGKWGEDNLNNMIQGFLKDYSGQKPPYPTSSDFIKVLYRKSPQNLHNFIHTAFETNNWPAFAEHLPKPLKN